MCKIFSFVGKIQDFLYIKVRYLIKIIIFARTFLTLTIYIENEKQDCTHRWLRIHWQPYLC